MLIIDSTSTLYGSKVEEALSLLKQDDFVLVCVPGYNAWLISAPTRLACERLEAVKKRPKGKRNFTHAIGDLDKFYDIIDKECIPPSFDSSDKLKMFEQAHMRIAITQDESVNNILVRNGLMQGTLWPEADFEIRNFFKEIEAGLEGHCDPDMINGNVYHTALVTSANFHGEGNIEDFEKAKEFGMKVGVKLCISFEQKMDIDPGCWSIFELRKNSITTTRKGTVHSNIIDRDSIKSLRVSFAKKLIDMLDLMNADTDINDVYSVFESIDSNGDGGLTEEELCNFFIQLSKNEYTSSDQKITDEDVSVLFRAIDINGDKEISFVELFEFLEYAYDGNSPQMEKLASKFLKAVRSEAKIADEVAKTTNDLQNIIRVFNELDADGSNDIDEKELGKLLFKHGFSKVEVKLLFSLMDKMYRRDGGINFTELFEFLKGLEKTEENIFENTSSGSGISTEIALSHDNKNESSSIDSLKDNVMFLEIDREQTFEPAPLGQSSHTKMTMSSSSTGIFNSQGESLTLDKVAKNSNFVRERKVVARRPKSREDNNAIRERLQIEFQKPQRKLTLAQSNSLYERLVARKAKVEQRKLLLRKQREERELAWMKNIKTISVGNFTAKYYKTYGS